MLFLYLKIIIKHKKTTRLKPTFLLFKTTVENTIFLVVL